MSGMNNFSKKVQSAYLFNSPANSHANQYALE